jgi:hypothetical protein
MANIENKPERAAATTTHTSHPFERKIRCVGNSRVNFTLGSKHWRVAEFMTRFRNNWLHLASAPRVNVRAHKVGECGGVRFVHSRAVQIGHIS